MRGSAFVQLTCTPAEARQTPPDQVREPFGSAALCRARAASDDMVNVIEAVQTSTEGEALVWTIGLRHSARWGIGNMSAAPGTIDSAPMVGIAQ